MAHPQPPPSGPDRVNRDRLAAAMRGFLAEELTAFRFDDEIAEAARATHDPTVEAIADACWFFYDDVRDHTAVLSKDSWDVLCRLLLVLESGYGLQAVRRSRWCATQAVAALGAGLLLWSVTWMGIGPQLLAVAMPLGLLSMGISKIRERIDDPPRYDPRLYPFLSFAQLRTARRSVRRFHKPPYPRELQNKVIRPRYAELLGRLNSVVLWVIMGPVVLGWQTLPIRESDIVVVAGG